MEKVKKVLIDVIEVILSSLIIFVLISNFVLYSVEVQGGSMNPTLQDADRGISLIITKMIGLDRFDIVTIKRSDMEHTIVKRIIGMPNEKIEFKDNKLYINDEYVAQDFLEDDVVTADFVYELKDNEYYCLGDNRPISKDSRYYGPFNKEDIISSHIFIFKPFNRFGFEK